MALLARSMVKSPELLILDEPCQGLDHENRRRVLDMIEKIGARTDTNLLYVPIIRMRYPNASIRS